MIVLEIILTIPLVLNIAAVVSYRRWFRIVALCVLPLTTFATIVDVYSASQKGNLTGILTFFVSGPAIIVLFLLGIGNFVQRSQPDPLVDPGQVVEEATTLRTARGAISGAVLAVAGLILTGVCSRFLNFHYEPLFMLWLGSGAMSGLAWAIVALLGAVVGGLNSYSRRSRSSS